MNRRGQLVDLRPDLLADAIAPHFVILGRWIGCQLLINSPYHPDGLTIGLGAKQPTFGTRKGGQTLPAALGVSSVQKDQISRSGLGGTAGAGRIIGFETSHAPEQKNVFPDAERFGK